MLQAKHMFCALCLLGGCAVIDPEATDRGCEVYARGACSMFERCTPDSIAAYGSAERCQQQLSRVCVDNLRQPDVLGSGAGAARCGELLAAIDCNDLFNQELPLGCQPASGRRSEGVSCSIGAQCASARCAKDSLRSTQGTCRERVLEGAQCIAHGDCVPGLVCTTRGVCGALAQLGQACSESELCRAPFWCAKGRCVDQLPNDPPGACARFGSALCSRLSACSLRLIETVYGDRQTCELRTATSCLEGFAIPDAISSADGVADCASALNETSCHALLQNGLPSGCRYAPGPRPEAASCSADGQCASTRCARAAGARCGVCAPLGALEQACLLDSDCLAGLVCSSARTCRAPAALGAACDANRPCAVPHVCASAVCGEALGGSAACDPANDACDVYRGLSCHPQSRKCEPWSSALARQACGWDATAGWIACAAGATCRRVDGREVCEAPAADGASCEPDGSKPCLAPARCIDGVCRFVAGEDCR